MSYVVLARKYRPQTFDQVIGQSHITDILKKGITADRLHHAFLFCGPRGIGKTSCARILAKSLNCQEGPTLMPCGKCFSCQEIASGNGFDVIEIDGASNRGIDEIRTLRENVKFAPSYGKYKIYIVDEVHMLTSEAFNALLKTLEEPPEHVKFIFATTEANKVPSTIISRCQRFDFKRISVTTITETLEDICRQEKFTVDADALFAVAKAAGGSMRDALSILDQLSALSDRGIVSADVYSMLGLVETQLLFDLVDFLGDKDCGQALKKFDDIINQGKDIKQLGKDLTEHFRHLLIIKVGGKALGKLVDYPVAVKEMLLVQTDKFSVLDILQAMDLMIESQEVSRVMETQRMPLEMAFAKLTYHNAKNPPSTPAPKPAPTAAPKASSPSAAARIIKSNKGYVDVAGFERTDSEEIERRELGVYDDPAAHAPSPEEEQVSEPETVSKVSEGDADFDHIAASWNAVTYAISKQKISLAAYLQEGRPYAYRNNEVLIAFAPDHAFQKECCEQTENAKMIRGAFNEVLGFDVGLIFELVEGVSASDDGDDVEAAVNMFGGEVTNQWHKGEK